MYLECFDGIGELKNFEYYIELDPTFKPRIQTPHKVALSIEPKLKKELDHMEKQGIIDKPTGPTEWLNNLVIREKSDGQLHICLDPKYLNEAIKREHHPIPTLEEITPKLCGSTLFSKLNAKQGYWNVKLDATLSLMTTFHTPFGWYKFLWMPFWLRMSQDIFPQKIDQTYENCKGAVGKADDVHVFGNEKTHDRNLHEAMECTRKAGIKLNFDKFVIKTECCSFFGNLYTPEGVNPDPKKVDAIKQMQPPMNKPQLSSFLGMVTYLSQYMPKISSLTSDLRGLLKKDALFQWSEVHDVAFQKIKNQISEDVCLRYFYTIKEVVLQVDASQVGLDAVLLKDGKPVAYESKALTPTEMRYANIEREMLVVVFGCLTYHHYLYGRRFVCRSDHQPLEKNPFKEFIRCTTQTTKITAQNTTHMILKSSTFQGKRLHLQMPSIESTLKTKWN